MFKHVGCYGVVRQAAGNVAVLYVVQVNVPGLISQNVEDVILGSDAQDLVVLGVSDGAGLEVVQVDVRDVSVSGRDSCVSASWISPRHRGFEGCEEGHQLHVNVFRCRYLVVSCIIDHNRDVLPGVLSKDDNHLPIALPKLIYSYFKETQNSPRLMFCDWGLH